MMQSEIVFSLMGGRKSAHRFRAPAIKFEIKDG
jgi:hypothetical protein